MVKHTFQVRILEYPVGIQLSSEARKIVEPRGEGTQGGGILGMQFSPMSAPGDITHELLDSAEILCMRPSRPSPGSQERLALTSVGRHCSDHFLAIDHLEFVHVFTQLA